MDENCAPQTLSQSENVTYEERQSLPLDRVFGLETGNLPFYRPAEQQDRVVDTSIAKQLMKSILGVDTTRNIENMTAAKPLSSNSIDQSAFERNYLQLGEQESSSRLKDKSSLALKAPLLSNFMEESLVEIQVQHPKSRQAPLEPAIIERAEIADEEQGGSDEKILKTEESQQPPVSYDLVNIASKGEQTIQEDSCKDKKQDQRRIR